MKLLHWLVFSMLWNVRLWIELCQKRKCNVCLMFKSVRQCCEMCLNKSAMCVWCCELISFDVWCAKNENAMLVWKLWMCNSAKVNKQNTAESPTTPLLPSIPPSGIDHSQPPQSPTAPFSLWVEYVDIFLKTFHFLNG